LLLFSIIVSLSGALNSILVYLSQTKVLPTFVVGYFFSDTYGYKLGLFHPKIIQQTLVVLLVIYLKQRTSIHKLPYFTIIFNVYVMSTLLFIIFSDNAILSTRFGGHFYSVEPVLLVYITYSMMHKKIYLSIVTIFAIILSFINYIIRDKLPPYEVFNIS
jgi:hypothetical protein